MPVLSSIGNGVAATALALLGVGAGVASFAEDTSAPPAFSDQVVQVVPAHPDVQDDDAAQTSPDAYGCWFDPTAPAWESASTADGLCHDGPHAHEVTDDPDDGYLDQSPARTVAYTAPQPQPRPAPGSCGEPLPTPPAGTPTTAPQPQPKPQPQTGGKVNVNTASVAQLEALPGIGKVLAARIVQQRPYSTVDDLHRVARIPAKVFPLVTV